MQVSKENFFTDNEDIFFHVAKQWDFGILQKWTPPETLDALGLHDVAEFRKTWLDVLESFGALCGESIAPNARAVEDEELKLNGKGDVEYGPILSANMRKLIELGVPGIGISPQFGGLGAPFCIELVANEILYRSCPSTLLNASWWSSIAHVIDLFGTDHERDMCLAKIASGEWSGSMALTEPDAGSDLGSLRTYGEKQPDGSWKLYGTKRFISNGNGQVCLVLAKGKKGAQGLKELNLFLCLHEIDGKKNYEVSKLEHKVGLRGSPTCELKFDGAKAWLLGQEGDGFRCMLKLMNDARLAVGIQGVGLMEATLKLAKDYAAERTSWGKPIAEHELVAEMLLDMEVELKGLRSVCYKAAIELSQASIGEKYLKSGAKLTDSERNEIKSKIARMQKRVRRITPLVKFYAGERAYVHARKAIQILGGYGFTTEYRAEWWLRESLILSIYEGTSQIQAMMVMKDTLKDVIKSPKRFIEMALGSRVRWLTVKDPLRNKLNKCRQIYHSAVLAVVFQLVKENVKASVADMKTTDILRAIGKIPKGILRFDSLGSALLHSERLAEMKTLVMIGKAVFLDAKADKSRKWIAERHLARSIPRLTQLKMEIDMGDAHLIQHLARNKQATSAHSHESATSPASARGSTFQPV